jgi:hypothetical protein
MVFFLDAPKNQEDFIKKEREADERRRRELVERLKVQEQERIRGEEKKESETRAKFRALGSKSLDVAKALGRNAKENLSSPETKKSLKKTGRSALKVASQLSKNYESNFTGQADVIPQIDFSFNPFEPETKRGKKVRSDPTGSGLDMDAYLNSFVPQPEKIVKAKKSKAVKSDVYDPFAGLNFDGYLQGFSGGGSSKNKRRSKDPIGQFFY